MMPTDTRDRRGNAGPRQGLGRAGLCLTSHGGGSDLVLALARVFEVFPKNGTGGKKCLPPAPRGGSKSVGPFDQRPFAQAFARAREIGNLVFGAACRIPCI